MKLSRGVVVVPVLALCSAVLAPAGELPTASPEDGTLELLESAEGSPLRKRPPA